MKKFMEITMEFKSLAALIFSGEIIMFMLIGLFTSVTTLSFINILLLLVISILITALVYVFLITNLLNRFSYTLRYIVCTIIILGIITKVFYIFNWFDLTNITNKFIYYISLIIIYLGFTFGLYIYNKITEEKFSSKLAKYKLSK
jgi:hypothetical protein